MDHVEDYKMPKDTGKEDDLTKKIRKEGCAPIAPQPQQPELEEEEELLIPYKKPKKGIALGALKGNTYIYELQYKKRALKGANFSL